MKPYKKKITEIGIIGALDEEINAIKHSIKRIKTKKVYNYTIDIGLFNNITILLIKSGIGKVSAGIAATILVTLYKPDIIINIGSSGSLKDTLKIGDLVIPKKICYHDVNLQNFGYKLGQIPGYPDKFHIPKKLHNFLKQIAMKFNFRFSTQLLVTGDMFIGNIKSINTIKKNFSSVVTVEMESAAIAQVCYAFKVPFAVIKSISDSSDKKATKIFKKNLILASYQSCKFLKLILTNIKLQQVI